MAKKDPPVDTDPPALAPLAASMRAATAVLRAEHKASKVNRHPGLKGRLLEEALADALQPFIPTRFEVSGPSVIASVGEDWENEVRRERDLVVTDGSRTRPHMFGNRIHPIEAVTGIIEVKANGEAGEIKDAVEKLSSVIDLIPRTVLSTAARDLRDQGLPSTYPFTGIFCYDAKNSDDSVIANFRKSCRRLPQRSQWPTSLCVLGRFATQWVKPAPGRGPFPGDAIAPDQYGRLAVYRETLNHATKKSKARLEAGDGKNFKGLALYVFHLALLQTIESYVPPAFVWARYFDAGLFHLDLKSLP